MRKNYLIGKKVKVTEGSGIDSGKIGIIVDRSKVRTDGQGIPTNVEGCYKPIDWSKEVLIEVNDTGELITMFKNRIIEIEDKEDTPFFKEIKIF